ncbi:MAG: penicillin-binding protein 1C [Lentisphaeria bacterium]
MNILTPFFRGVGGRRRWWRWLAGGALAAVAALVLAWFLLPFPRERLARYPAATLLLDRDGAPLRLRLGPNDTDCRLRYQPDDDRDWIAKAVVAAEDQRFWRHHGVDPLALGRAVGQNLRGRRVVSGASTITTQVVRLVQPRRRTLATKAVELFRALQLERILDKPAILEQYLNRTPFGANLVGVEAASRRYFGKAPGDLSLAEAALLAGLPQSPSRLRPDRFPARARQRQAYVLDRMLACGFITAAQRAAAAAQPVVLRKDAYPFRAPHFCDLLLDERPQRQGQGRDAAVVRTTLDPALQRLAEEILRRRVEALHPENVFGGAVVILEVKTGAVRALVGAPDYRDAAHAGQVNGAAAPRSAGSTLKPFAYALAMDQGRITPASLLADVPRTFRDYAPVNFDGEFNGPVTARAALVRSLNIPALTLVEQEGVGEFLGVLQRLGLGTLKKSAAEYGLGLAIGNGPVRLLDLANAYACLARGGEWRPYRLCEATIGPESNKAAGTGAGRGAGTGAGPYIFSPAAAWLVAEMLSGEERAGDTTGHHADVRLPRVAWKTGTSSGFRDAWSVAFNPEYVVAVWLGNPDGRAAPALVGAKAAVPVMWEIVRGLYPANDAPWFTPPPGVVRRAVCAVSGAPPCPQCAATVEDWCIAGVSSARPCDLHRLQPVADPRTGGTRMAVVEAWPPELAAFLRARTAPVAAMEHRAGGGVPRLISPAPGAVYRKLDDFAADQRLPLKGECAGGGLLYWFVDNQLVAAVPPAESASWPLVRGRHTVVCCTPAGRAATAEIRVE